MTDHDNQFTDAAQLVASHRAAHAETATARLAQVSPDATLVQDERFMAMRRLLQAENEIDRLRQVMVEVADMGTLSVSERTFGQAAAKLCYMRDKLRAALDADGERAG